MDKKSSISRLTHMAKVIPLSAIFSTVNVVATSEKNHNTGKTPQQIFNGKNSFLILNFIMFTYPFHNYLYYYPKLPKTLQPVDDITTFCTYQSIYVRFPKERNYSQTALLALLL